MSARPAQARRKPAARKVAVRSRAPARVRAPVSRPMPMVRRAPANSNGYSYANPGPFGQVGRALGGALGGYLGGPAGASIGQAVGGAAHYVGKLFGSGDYRISPSKPISYNTLVNSTQIPDFVNFKNDFIRIRHHEYIGDIYTSSTVGAFQIASFAVNPGLSATFPYLGELSGGMFQQYRLNGVLFSYCSRSSDSLNSTNTALGSVIMATEYDSLDAEFASRQEMENSQYSVSCKPSENMVHGIECARNQTSVSELYMRSSAVPTGGDIRLYDHCRFSIATQGFQAATVNIGSLYVTYDISFFKPIQPPAGFFTKQIHYNLAADDAKSPLKVDTSVHSSQPVHDSWGVILAYSGTTTITLDPRKLQKGSIIQLQWSCRGASTASVTSFAITPSNGLVTTHPGSIYINGGSSDMRCPGAGEALTTVAVVLLKSCTYDGTGTVASPPTLTFAAPTVLPGATVQGGDLILTLMNPGIIG